MCASMVGVRAAVTFMGCGMNVYIHMLLQMVCMASVLSACSSRTTLEPPRPANVADTAIWYGGPEIGYWFDCRYMPHERANWCAIYNDPWDGNADLLARALFVRADTGEGVPGVMSGLSFDGFSIRTANGRVLEPLRAHRGESMQIAPIEARRPR